MCSSTISSILDGNASLTLFFNTKAVCFMIKDEERKSLQKDQINKNKSKNKKVLIKNWWRFSQFFSSIFTVKLKSKKNLIISSFRLIFDINRFIDVFFILLFVSTASGALLVTKWCVEKSWEMALSSTPGKKRNLRSDLAVTQSREKNGRLENL